MKKGILFVVILPVLVFVLSGVSYAWQGRMGGMEDPYGLVQDESDYLIHPAKIANGEGVRFYGDYRFTYTGVTNWDASIPFFARADVSGEELGHNGLLGTAFPLGPGRMGIFFTYEGMRGSYDGSVGDTIGDFDRLDMNNNLDNFALRLLYGMPIGGGFKLGGEAQLAYRAEEQELNDFALAGLFAGRTFLNENFGAPYPFPNWSRYWEALFKGSLDGKVGPLDLEFTLRGGFDFGGRNKWDFEEQQPIGTPINGWVTRGDVQGWQIGEDLWLRYPLADGLTLPFLVRVDYLSKTREGNGFGFGGDAGSVLTNKDNETDLTITVGGGVDKEIGKDTRIAAGIYYNYLQRREDFFESMTGGLFGLDLTSSTFPDSTEHQVLLRMAGEHTLSPTVALRAGLDFFYGWVIPQEKSVELLPSIPAIFVTEQSGQGSHWGIGASLGGTIKVKPLTFEPFVNGGWQQLNLNLTDERIARDAWYLGVGFSVLFNL